MITQKNIPNKPGIYRIYNSEKSYVGASTNLKSRILKHKSYLKNNKHHNSYLQRSYNLNPNSFNVEILKILNNNDRETLLVYETYFHIKYDSIKNGFNIDYPKNISNKFKLTEFQIKKAISKSCKKVMAFNRYNGNLIYEFNSLSEAAKKVNGTTSNISKACKEKLNHIYGFVFCYKENYDKNKNYSFPEDHKKGKPHSEKHKIKLRMSNSKNKKIYKYDLDYNLIKEYVSISEAERSNNYKIGFLRYKVGIKTPLDGYFYTLQKIKI